MLSVKKLHDDLDYWIHLGIGEDIVAMPYNRKEYQHLVKPLWNQGVSIERIPELVLLELKRQLQYRSIFRKTTYVLLWLEIKKYFKK